MLLRAYPNIYYRTTFFICKGVAPGSTTPFFEPLLAYNDSLIPLSFAYNRKTLGHRGSYDS